MAEGWVRVDGRKLCMEIVFSFVCMYIYVEIHVNACVCMCARVSEFVEVPHQRG